MTRGKQSFLGGAALLTVTMLVTKAIGALYKIPLGNLLDEQGMNYFYAAYNIYNLLLMVSTAGLPLALSRLVSQAEALGWVNRRRRIVSVAFWLFLLLGLLSSGLMFFLAGDLAGWMHNTRAEDAIRVLSPAVLCVCLVSVIRGYTQGMGDMRPTAASEVIESASKLMVGLGLAWWLLRQGYPSHIAAAGAIAGVTAGVILSLLALTVWTATHLSRDKGRDDPGQSRDILRQLLAIGVPITVGSVSLSVINLLDQSITMGILQTSWGLTEAEAGSLYGVYSYAGNLFALPAAFIYPLTISLIPAIGAALARGDRRLGPVIAWAVEHGAHLDGWDEYFQYQTWLDAFAACGLDPDFYTVRGYGEEELLPWQTLSVGVDPGFLLRERRRAYEGLVTPDCRQACAGCGANRLLKEVGCDA